MSIDLYETFIFKQVSMALETTQNGLNSKQMAMFKCQTSSRVCFHKISFFGKYLHQMMNA